MESNNQLYDLLLQDSTIRLARSYKQASSPAVQERLDFTVDLEKGGSEDSSGEFQLGLLSRGPSPPGWNYGDRIHHPPDLTSKDTGVRSTASLDERNLSTGRNRSSLESYTTLLKSSDYL